MSDGRPTKVKCHRKAHTSFLLERPLPSRTSVENVNMSAKPTIILVHGAWHQPAHLDAVVNRLRDAGFETKAPKLPSVGISSDPGNALHLDAAAVRDALSEVIVHQGQDVVLVMHSYGGLAGTEGYGMFQESRKSGPTDSSAGVRRLVYLAAHGAIEKGTVHRSDMNLPYLTIDVWPFGSPAVTTL